MKKLVFTISLIVFCAGVLFIFVYLHFNDGKLHLVVCDVGQGDAIFIRTPNGSDILVDGGPDKSVLTCLSNNMPFWDKDIEAAILTHPDADHLTGMTDVLQRYSVRYLFTQPNPGKTDIYRLFKQELAEKKLSAKFVEAGDMLKIDKISINILSPASNQPDPSPPSSLNIYSVVVKLTYGKFSVLLTGDAPDTVGDRIAEVVGKIDVLKVPHHGSKTGMTDYFLATIQPQFALISVGAKNRYGHPSQTILDLLRNHNIKTYRTDDNGEIDVLSDGLTYSIELQRR